MFRRMKNFLGAVEVKKFSKIQYIRNLRSGLTDTRDFKITFFVCLSFNKKIGGIWSPPRHLVRKIWHQTHVVKATAMRLEFLKNFWVDKNTTEASKRGKIRRNFWVDRSIIFWKNKHFLFFSSIKNDCWVVQCFRCHQSKALIICDLKHMHNFFIANLDHFLFAFKLPCWHFKKKLFFEGLRAAKINSKYRSHNFKFWFSNCSSQTPR